jgi:hypothetical protein
MTTCVINDRETAIRVGYEATDWTTPPSFENYCAAVKEWSISTIERDGNPIGAVYKKNDEIHFSILPAWRKKWLTKNLVKTFFLSGKVTTKVTPGHDYMYDVLKRLGFKESTDGMLVKEN